MVDIMRQTAGVIRAGTYVPTDGGAAEPVRLPPDYQQRWGQGAVANGAMGEVDIRAAPRYTPLPVDVWQCDTAGAVQALQKEGFTVAALNMANELRPGGDVWRGGHAQEEELCRRSDLLAHLDALNPLEGAGRCADDREDHIQLIEARG